MEESSKYLIHADVTVDGIVERSDVVGAIFGQTEGLLGDELDLRDLRHSQKVGRIDASITSSQGQSRGEVTIATDLDKVETATLAAAFETITRIGPCRAQLQVREIEDVRSAKRKQVVERATELVQTGFEDSIMSSEDILASVRQQVRVEDITEYEGLPAGPRVPQSDAIIIVEGRSDVLALLKYGVKNSIAVEGTDVPEAVAELTSDRTVTAFFDGDRGGTLILEELTQVGDVDYVAFAPEGGAVEDLERHQVFAALRNKVPIDDVSETPTPPEEIAATDGSTTPASSETHESVSESTSAVNGPKPGTQSESKATTGVNVGPAEDSIGREHSATEVGASVDGPDVGTETDDTTTDGTETSTQLSTTEPSTDLAESSVQRSIYAHVTDVIRNRTDQVRLLDDTGTILERADAGTVSELLETTEPVPSTVVLDGILDQQTLDVAADRGIDRIVARRIGQCPKRPTDVRVHRYTDVAEESP